MHTPFEFTSESQGDRISRTFSARQQEPIKDRDPTKNKNDDLLKHLHVDITISPISKISPLPSRYVQPMPVEGANAAKIVDDDDDENTPMIPELFTLQVEE